MQSEIEGSFQTQQIKGVHKGLLAFQIGAEERFEKLDGKLGKVESGVQHVDSGLRGLRRDMPEIVASAMREVERERKKSRKMP